MTKVTWNFALQSTPWENAKLKCSEVSTLQNRQIKMQLKYSVYSILCYANPQKNQPLEIGGSQP